jgi:hypothetical protein
MWDSELLLSRACCTWRTRDNFTILRMIHWYPWAVTYCGYIYDQTVRLLFRVELSITAVTVILLNIGCMYGRSHASLLMEALSELMNGIGIDSANPNIRSYRSLSVAYCPYVNYAFSDLGHCRSNVIRRHGYLYIYMMSLIIGYCIIEKRNKVWILTLKCESAPAWTL